MAFAAAIGNLHRATASRERERKRERERERERKRGGERERKRERDREVLISKHLHGQECIIGSTFRARFGHLKHLEGHVSDIQRTLSGVRESSRPLKAPFATDAVSTWFQGLGLRVWGSGFRV